MNGEQKPVLPVIRKLNLIDAMINADDEDPRALHFGSKVLLLREMNAFGRVEVREADIWLAFDDESPPCRVTDLSVPHIVEMIKKRYR